jgi:glutamate formiminotransferase/formiminotetrahydrofolate cyclodeaminase
MPRFADLPISAFADALASAEPTPGGGTAAAVAGAMGTALLMMVAGLKKTRGNNDQERATLSEARAALTSVKDRLLALADTDAESYDKVVKALRLPKASDADKQARSRAIQAGTRAATEAPLDILRTIVEGSAYAQRVAQFGNPNAASDVRVAIELLEAAAAGAAANVETNLVSLDDEAYRKATASTIVELSNALTEHSAAARAALLPTAAAGA